MHTQGEVLSWKKQMILQAKTNIETLPMHMHYMLSCTEAERQRVPGKLFCTAHPGRAGRRQAKALREFSVRDPTARVEENSDVINLSGHCLELAYRSVRSFSSHHSTLGLSRGFHLCHPLLFVRLESQRLSHRD